MLTPKKRLFVAEYLIDLNATQAAMRAGYSAKTAHSQGPRLLEDVEIRKMINSANESRAEKAGISAQWVLDNIKAVAVRCMQGEPVREKIDGEWVNTGEWKFDSSGANKALENLGKHLKLFTDKIEHTGNLTLESIVANSFKPEPDGE